MQNCVCANCAPAAILPFRLFGCPARRRIDRHVGGADEELGLAGDLAARGQLAAVADADRGLRSARRNRDRTPAWRRADRPRSDRRRAAPEGCGCRAPPRRADRSAARAGCGRGRSAAAPARCRSACRIVAAASAPRCARAPAPSVTFTASARPFSGSALASSSSRVARDRRRDLGGDDEPAGGDRLFQLAAGGLCCGHFRLSRTWTTGPLSRSHAPPISARESC